MKRAAEAITATVLAALVGLAPGGALGQCCGDCSGDGTVTIDEILKAVNHALMSCSDDGICSQCGGQRFLASGQTTAYGPGSDGAVQAGAALSYTDNGDGTITDNNTGLMWEKKDDSGGIHDQDNGYTWGLIDPPYTMEGTMVTEFLATLNKPPCFASHCDWRIPNVRELQSLVDYENDHPAVSATFNTNCVAGCTANGTGGPMCSCEPGEFYWSSTTDASFNTTYAWIVEFARGQVLRGTGRTNPTIRVRAVRGGL